MTDWDDIRYFLAVARSQTVRAAAERVGVNHSTILRRIGQLEARLGALLFDKQPSGYRLSETGREVLEIAEDMDNLAHRFEARIAGRDQAAAGSLRVALPPTIATHLLGRDLADFARLHPAIEIEVLSSYEPVNLTNREADVAIRVVYDRDTLPLNLHGSKGPPLHSAVYIARDLLARYAQGSERSVRWILRSDHGMPEWATLGALATTDVPYKTNDAGSQINAVQQGLGVTVLSCFVGDRDPSLSRVPGSPMHPHGTLWVLTQGDRRKTKRVRLFTEFIHRRLQAQASLLAGENLMEEQAADLTAIPRI